MSILFRYSILNDYHVFVSPYQVLTGVSSLLRGYFKLNTYVLRYLIIRLWSDACFKKKLHIIISILHHHLIGIHDVIKFSATIGYINFWILFPTLSHNFGTKIINEMLCNENMNRPVTCITNGLVGHITYFRGKIYKICLSGCSFIIRTFF